LNPNPLADTDKVRLLRLNALLGQALALPLAARAQWLADLPAADRGLSTRLAELLARAEVETDDFLHQPLSVRLEDLASLQARPDQPGDAVGPYRLLHELGAGGMATVWLAERLDKSLQRQVALKLPREGWALGLAQRMARERDILAALEHPLIARLYEAGVTEAGRPWLAMEHLLGEPIDAHCSKRGLPLAARVALVLQVLDAVAYAHGRLVVHRDLKPGNILVTPAGQVRLLDFGVAKLLLDDGTAQPHVTQLNGRAITPDYAAPEQIAGRAVTVAADVYSMGVLLFELLSGTRPFARAGRSTAALEEAVTKAERPLASSRAADAATARQLRGDLDAIVNKALRIDPARRYTSAEAMAADLQRWQNGLPVLAQRQSRGYRAWKFLRRHRWPVLGAGTVALSLLSGTGLALWQAHAAQQAAARADKVKAFISSILSQAAPRQGGSGAVLASDLLLVAGQRIDTELADYPQAAAELGVIVGQGLSSLGVPQLGAATLSAAVARAQQTLGLRHPTTMQGRLLLVESFQVQRPDEARRMLESLVPDALVGLPGSAEIAVEALRQLSFQQAKRNHADESIATLQQAIAVAEAHLGPVHEGTVTSIGLLSNTYGRFGRFKEQLAAATLALQRTEAGFGAQRPHTTLTQAERWYGEALRRNDKPADALPVLRRVLEDQRQLDGAETPRVRHAMFQLGLALAETGRLPEGIALVKSVVAMEARHNQVPNEDRLAYGSAYATLLGFARRASEALPLLKALDAIVLPEKRVANDNNQLLAQARHVRLLAYTGEFATAAAESTDALARAGTDRPNHFVEAHLSAALLARLQGRSDQALAAARRGWEAPARTQARPGAQAALAAELATAWLARGDARRAEATAREALALFDTAQVLPSPLSATAWVVMARLHLQAGRAAEAERALRPLAAAWAEASPESVWHGETLHWLAQALQRQGKGAEAQAMTAQARSLLQGSPVSMQALALASELALAQTSTTAARPPPASAAR
jgi:eukaryotic-like serine/threonine-protein kinase